MTDTSISPLRQRMTADMTIRGFTASTQRGYITAVRSFTLFFGWFWILRWAPKGWGLNALFEVTSAMSNAGLTSGLLTPDFPTVGKWIFMFLMWIGRLEIIPALVLLLTLPLMFQRSSKNGRTTKS